MKKTITIFTVLIFLIGCEIQNPGPIAEDALNNPDAVPGIVVGMSADLSYAYNYTTIWGSVWSDELTHSGTYAAPTVFSTGELNSEDVNPWWEDAQRARWVAESGLERLEKILGDDFNQSEYTARAYLYAGYSNRILGENACYAVIDGGARQDFTVHFERAVEHFSNAIEIAEVLNDTNLINAGLAGRASVKAALGNWTGAAEDAAKVPTDYVFEAVYSLNSAREHNDWPSITRDKHEYSVWGTQWAGVSDPRLPQKTVLTSDGDTAIAADGRTPWIEPMKHETEGDNIALSKGTEMLLIRAEMELRDDDINAAMLLINEARNYYGLGDLVANNLEEAWDHLQRERGAVLWLEGRRFWDLRRWFAEGESSPAYHGFLEDRDTCVPIGQQELYSNDNLN